jgi:hypothetical protein
MSKATTTWQPGLKLPPLTGQFDLLESGRWTQ